MTLRDQLLVRIEAYCQQTDTPPSRFGDVVIENKRARLSPPRGALSAIPRAYGPKEQHFGTRRQVRPLSRAYLQLNGPLTITMISETPPDLSLIAHKNEQILSALASLQDDLAILRAQVAQLHERVSKLEQDR